MAVPDEAVEAAANIIRERDYPDYTPDLDFARRVLRVAAPFIAAQAWDEGFKQGGPMHDVDYDDPNAHTRNPYRSGT